MKVKYINQFLFNTASYDIVGDNGQQFQLQVDYANGSYRLASAEEVDSKLMTEIADIAADLISRKHAVNIAEKS
jgi:hypothetical protein